mmetsp:Transcript_28053/g.65167  ORF Transcript_28053/g.65167 Transcript_28053/m.65167 type:complete len:118 (+) Transcript_28053:137-490(+)
MPLAYSTTTSTARCPSAPMWQHLRPQRTRGDTLLSRQGSLWFKNEGKQAAGHRHMPSHLTTGSGHLQQRLDEAGANVVQPLATRISEASVVSHWRRCCGKAGADGSSLSQWVSKLKG